MMRVFYTVDTEFWPRNPSNPDFTELNQDIQRDIYGATPQGEFGLRYQLDALDSEGLKGVFFVEPLSALRAGIDSLSATLSLIDSRGHEVGLHLHPEWNDWLENSLVPERAVQNISQLSVDKQTKLIAKGLSLFKEAGLSLPVKSFRAGNYGAGLTTLRALANNNIAYDSSYNPCYLNSRDGFALETPLVQAQMLDTIIEVPISCFEDYPRHFRHVQLTAISFEEMRLALETAERQHWKSFVIVSHSFELIKRNCSQLDSARPDYRVIDRFQKLIKYLGQNKDRYRVEGFNNCTEQDLLQPQSGFEYKPITGNLLNTLIRYMQQALRRMS